MINMQIGSSRVPYFAALHFSDPQSGKILSAGQMLLQLKGERGVLETAPPELESR